MTVTTSPTQKSTTVRMFGVRRPVRAAFAVLDRVAPAVGAAWAERIWFTLPAHARRVDPPPGGTPFAIPVDGHLVAGRRWGEGPAVYLLHGWAGHSGQYAPLVPVLVELGYRVVVLDAPSHGASQPGAFGPRSSSIPEFAAALGAVVAEHGPAHAIVAHSMGATAAATAVCDGLRADRLVLLAPMASPLTYSRQFATVLGFGARTHRRLVDRVARRVGAPMHHFDIVAIGSAVAMPKTLVVHDRDDPATPVADGIAVAGAWPSARLHLTSGLGHNRVLRDPDVLAEIAGFVSG
jgi:pimeloyl-ACP methyl ester carboxylesterase